MILLNTSDCTIKNEHKEIMKQRYLQNIYRLKRPPMKSGTTQLQMIIDNGLMYLFWDTTRYCI